MKLKIQMWKMGLYNKCPYCHKELMPHGFEGHNRAYTCNTVRCKFNE